MKLCVCSFICLIEVSTRAANKRCYSELYVIVLSDFFHTLRCNVRVVAEDGDISRCATSSSTQQLQTDSVVQRASVCLIRSTQTVRLSVDSIGGCFVLIMSNDLEASRWLDRQVFFTFCFLRSQFTETLFHNTAKNSQSI